MQRCFELAAQGYGSVAPNPMVGAVIVYKNKIIGEGFHRKFGGDHAEIDAIKSVADKSLLNESTIYVSLEPCSHQGKTPACSKALIEAGFPSVVIGQADPNPIVSGSGIKMLKEAGVNVLTGVLEEEARDLNRRFNTFHEKKRPYVILKWAETRNGYVDNIRKSREEAVLRISGEQSQDFVHYLRSKEDAFLVGFNTARLDNPKLSNRRFGNKQALRVLLDPKLALPEDYHLLDQSQASLVFNGLREESKKNLDLALIDFSASNWPKEVLNKLYQRKIQSLVIEGGPSTHKAFIDLGLWDEYYRFIAPFEIKDGVKAVNIQGEKEITERMLGKDTLQQARSYSS